MPFVILYSQSVDSQKISTITHRCPVEDSNIQVVEVKRGKCDHSHNKGMATKEKVKNKDLQKNRILQQNIIKKIIIV